MKKRNVVGMMAAAGLILWGVRFSMTMAKELRRYDHLRSLSNEGPVMEETPEMTLQVLRQQRLTAREWMQFFQKFPKDVARYMKIESM